MLEWLKKAPTSVVVAMIATCGFVVVAVLVSFVWLSVEGQDTTEFRQWINTLGQLLVFPLLGVGTMASVQAARSSSKTEDQTNGALTAKTAEIAEEAARRAVERIRREDDDGGPGGITR